MLRGRFFALLSLDWKNRIFRGKRGTGLLLVGADTLKNPILEVKTAARDIIRLLRHYGPENIASEVPYLSCS